MKFKMYESKHKNYLTLDESFDDYEWERVASKSVYDDDGFVTDYTWYRSTEDGLNIFMFGDSDIYTPDRDYADFETESDEEAEEWFDCYGDAEGIEDFDLTEANQKTYHFEFSVDGTKTQQDISANDMHQAEQLIRNQYGGKNIFFTKKQEVKPTQQQQTTQQQTTKQTNEDFVPDDEFVDGVSITDPFETIAVASPTKAPNGDALDTQTISPVDNGIAGVLNKLIQDEWQTVDAYNSAIQTIKATSAHEEMIATINDIINEENTHIGQLQTLMALLTPSVDHISDGEEEGAKQVDQSVAQEVQPIAPVENGFTAQATFDDIATAPVDASVADDSF